MCELDFLKRLKRMLEECGLEDTYLNDIIACRKMVEDRINQIKSNYININNE